MSEFLGWSGGLARAPLCGAAPRRAEWKSGAVVSAGEKRGAAWLQLSVRRKKTKQLDYSKVLLGCTNFGPMAGCWPLFELVTPR
jgi:hypothetical protein